MNIKQTIQAIKTVVPTRSTLPILEYVFLDGEAIICTNLEETAFISFASAKAVINAREFCEILKDYGEEFTLQVQSATAEEGIKVIVTHGEEKLVLAGEQPDNFPSVSYLSGEYVATLKPPDLPTLAKAVEFVSKDELRPAVMNVLWHDDIVATDGHRLFVQEAVRPTVKPLLLTPKAIKLLNIFGGNWYVSKIEDRIVFVGSEALITQKMCDGAFPNYKTFIPTNNDKTFTVPRKGLLQSIAKARRFAPATTNQIRLSLNATNIIEAEDVDLGKKFSTQIGGSFEGGSIEIGFDAKLLASILEHVDDDELRFTFSDSHTATVINDHYLLMPTRLPQEPSESSAEEQQP